MRVIAVLIAVTLCSSCAWLFQEHLPSEYNGRSQPICSSSKAWPVIDGIFAASNAIGLIAVAANDQIASDYKTGYIIGAVIEGVIHVASGVNGSEWADECRHARAEFDDQEAQQARADERRMQREMREPRRSRSARDPEEDNVAEPPDETVEPDRASRRVVEGQKSLWCATTPPEAGSLASGRCFTDQNDCATFRTTYTGAGPVSDCAQATAGACFNYTILITGERKAACAPSIAACERLLAQYGKNVDYQITAKQCGIYRVANSASGAGE